MKKTKAKNKIQEKTNIIQKRIENSKFFTGTLKTIRGKITAMGAFALVVSLVVGSIGMFSLHKNGTTNQINTLVNENSVMQYQNQSLEALYQYHKDQTYLENITKNLAEMQKNVKSLQKIAGGDYKKKVASLQKAIDESSKNYKKLIELHNSRGFNTESGAYGEYTAAVEGLNTSLKGILNGADWVELKWNYADQTAVANTKIDGKDYVQVQYKDTLPKVGKRNNMSFRLCGTFTYKKSYYITDVKFLKGKTSKDISLSGINIIPSGEAMVSAKLTTFNGKPAIKVTSKFNAERDVWEESVVEISITDYNIQNYDTLSYNMYMEPADANFNCQFGGAITGVYNFEAQLNSINSKIQEYSQLVVEGKDIEEAYNEIMAMFTESEENVNAFSTSKKISATALEKLTSQKEMFNKIKSDDDQILKLKQENTAYFESLSKLSDEISSIAESDMNGIQTSSVIMTIIIIIFSACVLIFITMFISHNIQKNVKSFQSSLEKITQGKISSRVDVSSQDEFGQFGQSLNTFLDTLEETIKHLQDASVVLLESGNHLEEKAANAKIASVSIGSALNDISEGAESQAGDVEKSSSNVIKMQNMVEDILKSIVHLSKISIDMNQKDAEASIIMKELNESNAATVEAFGSIASQICKTNEHVEKIQEAANLIVSIANQTNLLSLNASIEAARAGEAGKGFAVVASEIQKLAEQTNTSANIINEIIGMLTSESDLTVKSIKNLSETVDVQKEKLRETGIKFGAISQGIQSTEQEMNYVKSQATECNTASEQVADIMTNLSAIAEENVASTEQTTESMDELNNATSSLADTALELKELSDRLNTDLQFFQIEDNNQNK